MFQSTLGPADSKTGGAGLWGDTAEASAAAFAAGASGGAGSGTLQGMKDMESRTLNEMADHKHKQTGLSLDQDCDLRVF